MTDIIKAPDNYKEIGRAYDESKQRWALRLAVHTLGENLKIAGALEVARQQGMRATLDEIRDLESQFYEAMGFAFDEEVTGVHRIAD